MRKYRILSNNRFGNERFFGYREQHVSDAALKVSWLKKEGETKFSRLSHVTKSWREDFMLSAGPVNL